MKTIIFNLSILCLLTACMAISSRPTWVDGESSEYPEKDYLVANGSAANSEDAKNRALANLARIFEVRITDTATDRSQAQSNQSGVSRSQMTVRYVDAYTDKLLEGASIASMWFDEKSGQHYALAVMHKKQLTQRLLANIEKVDRATREYLQQANQSSEALLKLNYLYKAWQTQNDRAKFQQDLQIVDNKSAAFKPYWTQEQLNVAIQNSLQSIKAAVEVENDPMGMLTEILPAAIADTGITVVPQGRQYRFLGRLDMNDLGLRDGWYWYRGALELELQEVATQRVRGIQRWPIKASGKTQNQARIRLRTQLLALLEGQLKPTIAGFGAN